MARFLVHWLVVALGLWVADWLLPGVSIGSTTALLVAALVLGFINAVVRPILQLLSLPITVLTLGLFYFVVNGIAFALAAAIVPGFHVSSLFQAILGALVLSIVSWFVGQFLLAAAERRRD
jgi:putative membrane protein